MKKKEKEATGTERRRARTSLHYLVSTYYVPDALWLSFLIPKITSQGICTVPILEMRRDLKKLSELSELK